MAVRNHENTFYVCQAMQNIYKTTKRIRIRWLSQDENNGEIYSPDFYDHTGTVFVVNYYNKIIEIKNFQ